MSRKTIDVGDGTEISIRQINVKNGARIKGWGYNSHVYRWRVFLKDKAALNGEARGITTALQAAIRALREFEAMQAAVGESAQQGRSE